MDPGVNPGALMSLADCFAVLAGLGLVAALAGAGAATQFVARTPGAAGVRAPVSILKPLCGAEPLLQEALESFCRLDYGVFQLILGVQDPNDPALAIVARLRSAWPMVDIALVIDPVLHGPNRKISNLINMLAVARHDILVFSDSDLHVPPDYLQRLGDALGWPGVGLVTTLSTGRAARANLAAALGCLQISHCFLPGVLLSRLFGRQDCLGTTMALHRRTLGLAGGLAGLLNHLADDHVLGLRVRALGLSVALAPVITATTVSETGLAALWAHELRWARTIAALEPLPFLASTLQYPLFWAALAVVMSSGGAAFALLFAFAWGVRAVGLLGVARALQQRPPGGLGRAMLLLPLRDALSMAVVAASFCGGRVVWRGHVMRADDGTGPPGLFHTQPPGVMDGLAEKLP